MSDTTRYTDRRAAGQILADALKKYAENPNVLILALPRGGVPVAAEIARALHLPLDVFIVRKLGVPDYPELAMGAVASGDVIYLNSAILRQHAVSETALQKVIAAEQLRIQQREQLWHGGRALPALSDKTIILVDDGLATGATMQVAITALRRVHPARIIMAVPVGAHDTVQKLTPAVDEVVCPLQPIDLNAVGAWYVHFEQTEDSEVTQLLAQYASGNT